MIIIHKNLLYGCVRPNVCIVHHMSFSKIILKNHETPINVKKTNNEFNELHVVSDETSSSLHYIEIFIAYVTI